MLEIYLSRVYLIAVLSLALACGDDGTTSASATETTAATTTTGTTTTGTPGTTSTTTAATGATTGVVGCPGDSFEPNNVPANATPIEDGEFASVVCPLDVDYYAVTVSQETYLSAILYLTRADGVVALDLLGPEMELIRWSSGDTTPQAYPLQGIEAIHARVSRPETYLLRVSHYSGTVVPYSLVLQRFVDETP
ncbi:MAG TPA: hypothetical protein VIK91_22565 [Nannocystis sp.]